MTYKFKGKEPPVILKSTLPKISHTKMGHIEVADFYKMMRKVDKSPLAHQTLESGLAHVGGHPLVVQCVEFFLERIQAYVQNFRDIKTVGGNVVVKLDLVSISITFKFQVIEELEGISKEGSQGYFR